MVGALSGLLLACAADRPAHPVTNSSFVYGPYKHLNMAVDPQSPAAVTRVTGAPLVLATTPRAALMPGASAVSLAFASGECGQEHWGSLPAPAVAAANVAALSQAGIPYIISTGGEGSMFTCDSDTGMEEFVARYETPQLLGFDFDIESSQTPEMVRALVNRIKIAHARRPHLRISFTLPTFAASDASQASLNAQGQLVLSAIREQQLEHYYINLMVMNYGPANPAVCVVRDGRCDMGASGVQAARNLNSGYGVPMSRIELTAMIGVNDVVDNVFTVSDARALAQFVRNERLGGLHFWSLDRDTPCADGASAVSPTCSGLNTHTPLAFSRAFADALQ